MKNRLLWCIGLAIVCVGSLYALTTTYNHGGRAFWNEWTETKAIEIVPTDVNDFSMTVEFYGELQTVAFGPINDFNDSDFTISLTDAIGTTVWSKTDCNGTTAFRYAVSELDTANSRFRGAPVVGQLTVTIADANTTGVGSYKLRLYYQEAPQVKP